MINLVAILVVFFSKQPDNNNISTNTHNSQNKLNTLDSFENVVRLPAQADNTPNFDISHAIEYIREGVPWKQSNNSKYSRRETVITANRASDSDEQYRSYSNANHASSFLGHDIYNYKDQNIKILYTDSIHITFEEKNKIFLKKLKII